MRLRNLEKNLQKRPQSEKRYTPYWWYFVWTVIVAVSIGLVICGVYWMAMNAPGLLGYIGLGFAFLFLCAVFALMPWAGQED